MEEPWLEILEEPKQHDHRYRYKCEGNGAGSILGENSTTSIRTSPTIKIHNMVPKDGAVVVVSCVSRSEPFHPHPHSLVGTNCRDGVCVIRVKGDNIVKLGNVGIQCCRQQDTKEALSLREKLKVDPFQTGYDLDIRHIDSSGVRLCFQVFLPDANQKFRRVVRPIVTREIIDRRSVNKLEICRLSSQSAFSCGGEELFILCDKAKKGDVQVRFFELLPDGSEWEAFGGSTEVHRQCAVTCTTPRYLRQVTSGPASVWVQLFRPSDQMMGEPKPFQFIPNAPVNDEQSMLLAKRRKIEQRGVNITSSSSTGVLLEEQLSVLSYRQNAGLALMKVVGATTPANTFSGGGSTNSHATPSGGFTSLTPPLLGPTNAFLEDDLNALIDSLIPSGQPEVNVAQTSQQQVNLMPRTTNEVDLETANHNGSMNVHGVNQAQANQGIHMSRRVNIERGQFINFGQRSGNQRPCIFSQADLGIANHLHSSVNINQADPNQGIFTSNEEINVDVGGQHAAVVDNVWTGQPGVNGTSRQETSWASRASSVLNNDVGKLLNVDYQYQAGTVITITQDPVEDQFQQDNF